MSRRGDWWANTGHAQAKREQDERDGRPTDGGFDMMSAFFHDVPTGGGGRGDSAEGTRSVRYPVQGAGRRMVCELYMPAIVCISDATSLMMER